MSDHSYMLKYDEYGNTREIYVYSSGLAIHGNSYVNKGTAFTREERDKLGLTGMLPPTVRGLDGQVENSKIKVADKDPRLGPLVIARDATGARTNAIIDAIVRGLL